MPLLLLMFVVFSETGVFAAAIMVDLGVADQFAVLGGSTVTNTGGTNIQGDVGVAPGFAITGFPPGTVTDGTIRVNDGVAAQAHGNLITAYNFAAGQACGTDLTGQNLGGLTLGPGAYCFSSSAGLAGTLSLDAGGDPNAVFVFQIVSTLLTAGNSAVAFTNGGFGDSVFWQVGSSATLGTNTAFAGNILALTSVTLNTGASIPCGRALAINGAVTLDSNAISTGAAACGELVGSPGDVPEPATAGMLAMGLLVIAAQCRCRLFKSK